MSDYMYICVANPVGESNHELSEFMQENQLILGAKECIGIPVYIEHNTPLVDERIQPSGIVTCAEVNCKGELLMGFTTLNNKNGQIARQLLGEDGSIPEHLQMKEVSIGYRVKQDKIANIPYAHKIEELSICYEGARNSTKILGRFKFNDIIKQREDMLLNGVKSFQEKLRQASMNNILSNKV